MNHSKKLLALAAVLSLAFTACGQKKEVTKEVTPAAMKINGQVVAAADLERQREEAGLAPDSGRGITGKTMKSMIDKELLRQAAIKENLDKDEQVRASLSAADRMILASAYMQKLVASIGKPTDAEVSAYYNQNPDLFANRKAYDLQQVVIQGKPANADEIKAKLAGGISLKGFMRWLEEKKIPNNNQHISATSDQMREDVEKKFKDAHVGQGLILDDANPDQISVVFVNSVQAQPIILAQASPMIMKRLFNKKVGEAMESKMKQLREQAKIEYVAPFTENGKAPATEQ